MKAGIKYKSVVVKKQIPPNSVERSQNQLNVAWRMLSGALNLGWRIAFCDELVFSRATNQKRDWALKYSNTRIDQTRAYTSYVSVIAAVSADRGVDLIQIEEGAVNIQSFLRYVQRLRPRHRGVPLLLYLDNLAIHRSVAVREACLQRGIVLCFSPAWCPQYQPIERVFASVKRTYKRLKL